MANQVKGPHNVPHRLEGHEKEVTGVAWCPTDLFNVSTCSDDHTIRVWKLHRSEATPVAARKVSTLGCMTDRWQGGLPCRTGWGGKLSTMLWDSCGPVDRPSASAQRLPLSLPDAQHLLREKVVHRRGQLRSAHPWAYPAMCCPPRWQRPTSPPPSWQPPHLHLPPAMRTSPPAPHRCCLAKS